MRYVDRVADHVERIMGQRWFTGLDVPPDFETAWHRAELEAGHWAGVLKTVVAATRKHGPRVFASPLARSS
jgi:hypothetical protein